MAEQLFAADTPLGKAIYEYWRSLKKEDLQTQARLKRAHSLTDIVFVPGGHQLRHMLHSAAREQGQERFHASSGYGRLRIAMIAGMLAQVKTHKSLNDKFHNSTAVFMAERKKQTDAPCVSELRFRRLLQAEDLEALFPMLRRTFALINNCADVHALASDIWFWGNSARRQWAYDYYDKLSPKHLAG